MRLGSGHQRCQGARCGQPPDRAQGAQSQPAHHVLHRRLVLLQRSGRVARQLRQRDENPGLAHQVCPILRAHHERLRLRRRGHRLGVPASIRSGRFHRRAARDPHPAESANRRRRPPGAAVSVDYRRRRRRLLPVALLQQAGADRRAARLHQPDDLRSGRPWRRSPTTRRRCSATRPGRPSTTRCAKPIWAGAGKS